MAVLSSWPDVVVPTLLLVAWLAISPLPLQLLQWMRPDFKRSKYPTTSSPSAVPTIAAAMEAEKSPSSGYILPVLIHHARMLPKTSQHSFRYPSLFLALRLDDLEKGGLQLNRVFSYTPLDRGEARWNLCKLDPEGFGRRSFPGIDTASEMHQCVSRSILLKLLYELRARKYITVGPQDVSKIEDENPWDREVGEVWAIAMPTLLGLGGFNPLTVYYVYRPGGVEEGDGKKASKGKGKLWLVVLEVHNTFNERHVYICQVGVGEDEEQRRGYQHAWTFAREFHVSPFNDRLGYYQLLMNDLWSGDEEDAVPTLDVRLLLLSPGEDGDEEEDCSSKSEKGRPATRKLHKKLLATLMSSKATSNSLKPSRKGLAMTRANMLRALAAQPFDLVLPVSRIMWQAAKLHWKKGLPVFIRPEQRGEGLDEELDDASTTKLVSSTYDGLDWPVDLNPTQGGGKDKGRVSSASSSGSIYWNQDSFLEKTCQVQFERYVLHQSRKHKGVSLAITSRNAEVPPCYFYQGRKLTNAQQLQDEVAEDAKQLSLYTLSSSLYLDFALYTPSQARLFGSLMDRNWGLSSVEDYELFFSIDGEHVEAQRWRQRAAAWARQKHMRWALYASSSSSSLPRDKTQLAHQLAVDVAAKHPYNSMDTTWSFLIVLLLQVLIIRITAALSALLRIRYVRSPWAQVSEGYQKLLLQEADQNTPL